MSEIRERVESFEPNEDKLSYDHVLSIDEIIDLINTSPDYDFIKSDPHLGEKRLALLGLGGSYAYGTARPGSDVDIRGIALNSKEEILRGTDFEQVVDTNTDTTIYSLKKMVNLLLSNNPNTLEILGLGLGQIVYANFEVFQEMKELEEAFLSKRVIRTFGGYSQTQLRRLQNSSASVLGEEQRENHILTSIAFAEDEFKKQYQKIDTDKLRLYVDKSEKEDHEAEIFIDVSVNHYPLRDFTGYINVFHGVVREYDKVSDTKRNRRAKLKGKISKHSMHLVRLYHMCFDILENHRVITYRKDDHDLLMRIRNGEFIDDNEQPLPEFYEMVDRLEDRLKELSKTTTLPDEPDYERVYKWLESVNERIVLGLL